MTGSLQPAGEIEMYVEIEGEGPDLVLLHGGGGTVDDLAGLRSALRPGRRLIVPEQRAHGRTPDVGKLSYAQMAADTAALLDGLGVRGADLVGWSDGGIIAMMIGRDRSDLGGRPPRTAGHAGDRRGGRGVVPRRRRLTGRQLQPVRSWRSMRRSWL